MTVSTILRRIYGSEALAAHNYGTTLTSLGFAGTIVGMLTFGWFSDKMGRKVGMMAASGIVVLFSGLSAASTGTSVDDGIYSFMLGIGVGAEYPCGSVAASEQSEEDHINKKAQHRWLALATNHMIVWGFATASLVPLILVVIFGNHHLRAVWRLSLGLGIVPAFVVFIWRLSMDEPTRYKKDSMKHAKIPYTLVLRRYGWSLLGISIVWLLFDFIIYPFGLYASVILNDLTGGSEDLRIIFGWNVVINLFYIPGAMGGAFMIDYIGPKWTMVIFSASAALQGSNFAQYSASDSQIIGLLCQAVVGFLMSSLYAKLTKHIAAFAIMYGLFLSFSSVGPGNNTIVLASKTSPTAIRGQYYGVAAAAGKVGAFIAFPPMIKAFGGSQSERGNTGPFWVASGLAILSAIITLFLKPLDEEGLAREDEKFREYLEANGYDTSAMGLRPSESDSEKGSLEQKGRE
ncbi:hypothetical protein CVT24_000003 [Panaeolus cyanescens]|uniref:Major facilitator superfamily (MFS) profile domain-containing protein n=1 Tax=Panaeolus cyanescens TaxID=181874 RepID=A0A409VSD2_9AGAR|nr:hypothetical protein CVT24_000003 [Panaeolus cyanescens]